MEGLVRLAEGRMFYLLNDEPMAGRPRACFGCGEQEIAPDAGDCPGCGASMKNRRFLMTSRWLPASFEPFETWVEEGEEHEAVLRPVGLVRQADQLCAIYPYNGESLLLDECSPLPPDEAVRFCQRALGTLAWFSHHGVAFERITPANFLLDPRGNALYFDPEILELSDGPLGEEAHRHQLIMLAELLRRFTPLNFLPLWNVLVKARNGGFPDIPSLGDALQDLADSLHDPPPPVPASALTDVGLLRDLNEDNWDWASLAPGVLLYVVADGMGGHDSGEVASNLAASTLCLEARKRVDAADDLTVEVLENILDESFQTANNTVKENAENRGNDMGTTVVALLLIHDDLALIANVGDSRAYLLRDKVLHRVTRDHSLVQRMVEQNRITEEEARTHPHSNILLRTVGTERDIEIDIYAVEVEPGDRLLLCSDGLWGEVEDDDMEAILDHYEDLKVSSRELVRAAHHGGGRDNITLIIVDNIPSGPPAS